MSNILTLHNTAMDLALQGDISLSANDTAQAIEYYNKAFEAEYDAARLAEKEGNPEPGLSILFRSAASLAYQCGMMREAERIVAHALSGNPTAEIARELRDLLQVIYSSNNFKEEDQLSDVSYKLEIPKSEIGLFTTIAKKMGWSASSLRTITNRTAVML